MLAFTVRLDDMKGSRQKKNNNKHPRVEKDRWGAPSVFTGGRLRTGGRPRYTVKRSIFSPTTTRIWYHCVQTTFVYLQKNIPLRSMPNSSRYQDLNLLSERMATILFVDISGMGNLRTSKRTFKWYLRAILRTLPHFCVPEPIIVCQNQ